MRERRLTPGFLLLSVVTLLALIPGGPIENRVYPDIPVFVAVGLNLHAVILGTFAAFSILQTQRGGRQALYLAALEAMSFAAIYVADMSGAVPSASPAGDLLTMFNIVGLAAAVLLMASVIRDLRRPMLQMNGSHGMSRGEILSLMAFSLYVGVVLTFIATVNMVAQHPAFYVWYGMR
jgi:hypothetical protein